MKAESNEKALLQGLARSDKKAIEIIYRENYNMVQSLIINNSGSPDDAKDIFQEAMIVLYEKVRSGTFELNCLIKTYVYSVSRRLWLKRLQQMNRFGEWKKFKQALHETHIDLTQKGKIHSDKLRGRAKVVYLWNKYKRVTAIAASIAGITAIGLTILLNLFAPQIKDPKVLELVHRVNAVEKNQKVLDNKINYVDKKNQQPVISTPVRYNGTGFLIDPKGLMITNAHVVKNSRNIFVQNNKGDQFKAFVVKLDVARDVAIIKIDDDSFKSFASLPYGFKKVTSDIAEPIFTLGYPRDEVVY